MTITTPTNTPCHTDYPAHAHAIPDRMEVSGRYTMRFARNVDDLDAALQLRFNVFNLEMREGLDGSYASCRDRDDYDNQCHHLLVLDTDSAEVIGTYRMQVQAMADAGAGFYSGEEFDLASLDAAVLPDAVELGRACIARDHRNSRVLYLLWRGLAAYMVHNQKRYFFGCCSLTSQDQAEGHRVMHYLESQQLTDPLYRVNPQPGYECIAADTDIGDHRNVKLPHLMRLYMDYGARIASAPAIDREFKTIDYLALFDITTISARIRRMFLD